MKRNGVLALILAMLVLLSGCAGKANDQQTEKAQPESPKDNKQAQKETTVQPEESEEAEPAEPTEQTTELPQEQPEPAPPMAKKGILVALDPGHQSFQVDMSATEPNGPGSKTMKAKSSTGTKGSYTGIPEYQLNLEIAQKLKVALEQTGYDVIMTRNDNDTAISNAERATLANEAGAKFSLRIHANGSEGSTANGALVLVPSAQNPYVSNLAAESRRLGEAVLNSYCAAAGFKNRGIQENDTMTGINWSKIPVVILEMGFMTNEADDRNMADAVKQEQMVAGILAGINQYCGF